MKQKPQTLEELLKDFDYDFIDDYGCIRDVWDADKIIAFIKKVYEAGVNQSRKDLLEELDQLKRIHEMKLDALSLMSIEDFVQWKDNRIFKKRI